ncbi:MAG: PASTA domain-containing protein [Armatimonadetes bacterium]|nr:PASTA domain-containing protein [Armatimonadota bacterium]
MRKRRTWAWELAGVVGKGCLVTILTMLVIVGGAAGMASLALRPPAKPIKVPNVVGMKLEEAKEALAAKGLEAEEAGERYDDAVPAGSVCLLIPSAGKRVRVGRRVRLYVSKGPTSAVVPDLSGLTLEQARVRLGQAGLKVGEVSRKASTYVEGTVVGQWPDPKTKVVPGSEVSLEVSAGPDFGKVKLPDGTVMLARKVIVKMPEGEGYEQVTVEKKYKGLVDTIYDRSHRAGERVEVDLLVEPGAEVRVYVDNRLVLEQPF